MATCAAVGPGVGASGAICRGIFEKCRRRNTARRRWCGRIFERCLRQRQERSGRDGMLSCTNLSCVMWCVFVCVALCSIDLDAMAHDHARVYRGWYSVFSCVLRCVQNVCVRWHVIMHKSSVCVVGYFCWSCGVFSYVLRWEFLSAMQRYNARACLSYLLRRVALTSNRPSYLLQCVTAHPHLPTCITAHPHLPTHTRTHTHTHTRTRSGA